MQSTSFHQLNADNKSILNQIIVRFLYIILNRMNNSKPNEKTDPKLKYTQFRTNKLETQYATLDKLSSPSRKLSDLFWLNLDWNTLQSKLGKINVLDIGCGSGIYYSNLNKFSSQKITHYTGLDIYKHPQWDDYGDNTNFLVYDGKNLIEKIPSETNLIISQSAIEHIPNDLDTFKQIKAFLDQAKQPVVQIHLFPSAACLKLYRYHGLRQYTPRTISHITKLFSDKFDVELFSLGGDFSNKVHMKFITIPELFKMGGGRNKNEELYNKSCYNAIKKDMNMEQKNLNTNFYALLIKPKQLGGLMH